MGIVGTVLVLGAAVAMFAGLGFFASWITDEGGKLEGLVVDLPPERCVDRIAA